MSSVTAKAEQSHATSRDRNQLMSLNCGSSVLGKPGSCGGEENIAINDNDKNNTIMTSKHGLRLFQGYRSNQKDSGWTLMPGKGNISRPNLKLECTEIIHE